MPTDGATALGICLFTCSEGDRRFATFTEAKVVDCLFDFAGGDVGAPSRDCHAAPVALFDEPRKLCDFDLDLAEGIIEFLLLIGPVGRYPQLRELFAPADDDRHQLTGVGASSFVRRFGDVLLRLQAGLLCGKGVSVAWNRVIARGNRYERSDGDDDGGDGGATDQP